MNAIKVVLAIAVVVLIVLSVIAVPWLWVFILIVAGIGSIIWAILRALGHSTRLLANPKTEAEKESRRRFGWAVGLPLAIAGGLIVLTFAGMAINDLVSPADKQASQSQSESTPQQAPAHRASSQAEPNQTSMDKNDKLDDPKSGQSDAKRADAATAHINLNPPTYVRPQNSSSPSPGHLMLSIPSRTPIPTGNVIVASDLGGFGAVICPDEDELAGYIDAIAAPGSPSHKDVEIGAFLKPYGCSYLPPGTSMLSEGGNRVGSLAIVEAKLPDGTVLKGVTFPSMIVQNQQQREQQQQTIQ